MKTKTKLLRTKVWNDLLLKGIFPEEANKIIKKINSMGRIKFLEKYPEYK